MRGTVLAPGRLVCPNDCDAVAPNVARAPIGGGSSTMHRCPTVAGLVIGLVPEGTRAEARPVDREDYVRGEDVRLDANGRPVMAVVTMRDDGYDTTVYAPTATARREEAP